MKHAILLVALGSQRDLEGVLALVLQRLTGRLAARVAGIGQQLNALVQGIGGAEHPAELIRRGVEIAELAKFGTQVVGVLRIAQQIFLQFRRAEDVGQLVPGLLAKPGQLNRVGSFIGAPLCVQVSLQAVLRANADAFQALLDLAGERPEHGAVEHHSRPRGPGKADQIARFPVRPKQAGQNASPLCFQFPKLRQGSPEHIGVYLASPPLLLRRDQFDGPFARVNLVNVSDQDVANGLLRTPHLAQICGVDREVRRLNVPPGEVLPTHDHVGLRSRGRGLRRRSRGIGRRCLGRPSARDGKPHGCQSDIDAERSQRN